MHLLRHLSDTIHEFIDFSKCPYIYIYIVEEGLDGHGLLLLRVSRVIRSSDNSDDRITRETLSNNNPCPSSPSSTILRSAYMALNTLQQDWLL